MSNDFDFDSSFTKMSRSSIGDGGTSRNNNHNLLLLLFRHAMEIQIKACVSKKGSRKWMQRTASLYDETTTDPKDTTVHLSQQKLVETLLPSNFLSCDNDTNNENNESLMDWMAAALHLLRQVWRVTRTDQRYLYGRQVVVRDFWWPLYWIGSKSF